jgi:hypothetical protein
LKEAVLWRSRTSFARKGGSDEDDLLLGISAVVAAIAFNQVRASSAPSPHRVPVSYAPMPAGYFGNAATSPLQGIGLPGLGTKI